VKPWIWLRTLAGVLGLFAVGHTMGALLPHTPRRAEEAALLSSMQGYHFRIMGFDRSYWDFYRGFALFVSLSLVILAVLAWQVGSAAKGDSRRALPMIVALWLYCAAQLCLAWQFFFTGPLIASILAVAVATLALLGAMRSPSSRLAAASGE